MVRQILLSLLEKVRKKKKEEEKCLNRVDYGISLFNEVSSPFLPISIFKIN